ncbi:hypothetical protein NC652_034351 [Populus alba x Populus x berolinensis]|nr:hypothetical protein NC652_034351 [Populus alba x Populus x berolinensis]
MVMGSNASDSFRKLGNNQDLSDFVFGDGQTSTRKRGQNFREKRGPGSSDQLTSGKADLYHDLIPSSESSEEEE